MTNLQYINIKVSSLTLMEHKYSEKILLAEGSHLRTCKTTLSHRKKIETLVFGFHLPKLQSSVSHKLLTKTQTN